MSKNLCPENDIFFENSQTVRFETNIPAGTYTASAIVKSTDTDSSVCLMLFTYADNTTKEVYISRSVAEERVSKTFDLTQEAAKVRIYASEGYNLSVGDTATFNKLMIEAGSEMTDYVPYGDDLKPIPLGGDPEVIIYWMAVAGTLTINLLHNPTCRETHLIRKLLDPNYQSPILAISDNTSRTERYLLDLINGTTEMLSNVPKSDKEKYLHCMIGGTVDEMPNPNACFLNYWMNKALEAMKK